MINESRCYFDFQLPSELLMKRKDKFIEKIWLVRVYWITLPFSN